MTSFSPAPVSKLSIVTNGRWLNEDNLLLSGSHREYWDLFYLFSNLCVCSSVGPSPPVHPFVCLSAHLARHRSS